MELFALQFQPCNLEFPFRISQFPKLPTFVFWTCPQATLVLKQSRPILGSKPHQDVQTWRASAYRTSALETLPWPAHKIEIAVVTANTQPEEKILWRLLVATHLEQGSAPRILPSLNYYSPVWPRVQQLLSVSVFHSPPCSSQSTAWSLQWVLGYMVLNSKGRSDWVCFPYLGQVLQQLSWGKRTGKVPTGLRTKKVWSATR